MHQQMAFDAWVRSGGNTISHNPPLRILHGILCRILFPVFFKSKTEARLKMMSGYTTYLRAFPDYITHEIIPLFWDSWPGECFERSVALIRKCKVKTAIFTSSITANRMRECFPDVNILTITEGLDITLYAKGKELKDRTFDVLEFGRKSNYIYDNFPNGIKYLYSKNGERLFDTNDAFYNALQNVKITIVLPRSITHPHIAKDVETLTQRYWEAMASRVIMIGHAPQELIDLVGYNPVVEVTPENANDTIIQILSDLGKYQDIVNRNREIAIKYGSWDYRIEEIKHFLVDKGYKV